MQLCRKASGGNVGGEDEGDGEGDGEGGDEGEGDEGDGGRVCLVEDHCSYTIQICNFSLQLNSLQL